MRTDPEASANPSTPQQDDDLGSEEGSSIPHSVQDLSDKPKKGFFGGLLSKLMGQKEKTEEALREAIEEYIVEPQNFNGDSVSTHERILLSNILNLRDVTVVDAMIPRADIAAIDVGISSDELLKLVSEQQFSRYPVYKETLDDVLGTVHIKDVVAAISENKEPALQDMITEIPIVSPSLPILDLVLKMRHTSRHMALVVDEYGGIDGLITIADVIETIIGEVDDEHDNHEDPQMHIDSDNSVTADARVRIEEFERQFGHILNDEERDEIDTLGGLVFDLAGRVPARGEVISHSNGMIFKVLDADPRKINCIKISQIPEKPEDSADEHD